MRSSRRDMESLMDWICFELPSELRNNVVECLQVARVYSVPGPVQVIPYHLSANVSFSRDMLPQPAPGLNSCNWGSNLASSSEMDRRRLLQLTLGSLIQNSNTSIYQEATSIYQEAKFFVDNISFKEGMKNYHGQWAPCVTGVSCSAAATTNQQAPRVGVHLEPPPVSQVQVIHGQLQICNPLIYSDLSGVE